MTRVLLADRHDEVLRALTSFLEEEEGITIVGSAKESTALVQRAREADADLVLVEFGLPGCPPGELFAALHGLSPRPRVVAMSAQPEDSRAALRAGADGFLSKAEDGDWALDSLRLAVSKPGDDPGTD